MSELYPVRLERKDRSLEIEWSDGAVHRISTGKLRRACPCATCTEKHVAVSMRKPAELRLVAPGGEVPILARMEPVGNYGYNIHFGDGHHSGIFTFDLLRELGSSDGSPEPT